MREEDAIVNPIKGKHSPNLGALAVMVGTPSDLDAQCRDLNLDVTAFRPLFTSRLYHLPQDRGGGAFALTGPLIGAPYAVMVLETLIAWGAREFLFFGWCGSLLPQVKVGDILLPHSALIDEGTSRHYAEPGETLAYPSPRVQGKLETILNDLKLSYHRCRVWSTDAIFRETRQKVRAHQSRGIGAVEMELSALFTVAKFRGVDIGGVLVVSDELSALQWAPGFKTAQFKQARIKLREVITAYVRKHQSENTRKN
jgi:uridine phosphorylase